jgi:hypothetical protein
MLVVDVGKYLINLIVYLILVHQFEDYHLYLCQFEDVEDMFLVNRKSLIFIETLLIVFNEDGVGLLVL